MSPRLVGYRGPSIVTPTLNPVRSVVQEGRSAVLALDVLEHNNNIRKDRGSVAAAIQFGLSWGPGGRRS